MSDMIVLKNTSPDPIRLSYGGKTFLFAGTDRVTDAPIPYVMYDVPIVVEHRTVKGNFRKLPSVETKFDRYVEGQAIPEGATILRENMHKASKSAQSPVIALSKNRLKAFAAESPQVVDSISRLSMEKRQLESEKARLEAEAQALKEESLTLSSRHQAELAKMREELLAAQAKYSGKKG